jgi:hypothetical protein
MGAWYRDFESARREQARFCRANSRQKGMRVPFKYGGVCPTQVRECLHRSFWNVRVTEFGELPVRVNPHIIFARNRVMVNR